MEKNMQRNWDLIRKILIQVESLGDTQSHVEEDSIEGFDREIVSYHINLLIDAGLVKGFCVKGIDGPLRCAASSMTWEGHEFLDKIRSSTIWNKTKSVAREKGLTLSFDIIKTIATHAITSLLGS
jgi:hypothetical protein